MFPLTISDFTETVMVSSPFVHFEVKKIITSIFQMGYLLSFSSTYIVPYLPRYSGFSDMGISWGKMCLPSK